MSLDHLVFDYGPISNVLYPTRLDCKSNQEFRAIIKYNRLSRFVQKHAKQFQERSRKFRIIDKNLSDIYLFNKNFDKTLNEKFN